MEIFSIFNIVRNTDTFNLMYEKLKQTFAVKKDLRSNK